MNELPERHHLGIALEYTDNTPDDYEPKYFRAVTEDDNLSFNVKPVNMKLGAIKNRFIEMDVHMKTIVDFLDHGKIPPKRATDAYPMFTQIEVPPDASVQSSSTSLNSTVLDSQSSGTSSASDSPTPATKSSSGNPSSAPPSSSPSSSPPLHTPSPSPSLSSQQSQTPRPKPHEWRIIPETQDSDLGSGSPMLDSVPPSPSKKKDDVYMAVKQAILAEEEPTKKFVRTRFPELSAETITEIFGRLVAEDILVEKKSGRYEIVEKDDNAALSQMVDEKLQRVYQYALERDTVTQKGLRSLGLDTEAANNVLEKMEEFGILEKQDKKNKARKVIKNSQNGRVLNMLRDMANNADSAGDSAGSSLSQAFGPMRINNSTSNPPVNFSTSKTYSKKRVASPRTPPEDSSQPTAYSQESAAATSKTRKSLTSNVNKKMRKN
eukprot:Phypoly_transcript_08037.p1 GENE.Phypoly_transcript_08037~~Phypoly_transcript_08037.p1  ORF type:complete len:506 (+),score=85.94 Phypoly_transcript_08037:215-1519(+)